MTKIEHDESMSTWKIPCPGCGGAVEFFDDVWGESGILVRAESEQIVTIPGMITLDRPCDNPFCKWSKIEMDSFEKDKDV